MSESESPKTRLAWRRHYAVDALARGAMVPAAVELGQRRLDDAAWNDGSTEPSLPDDDRLLAELCRLGVAAFRRNRDLILGAWTRREDGRLCSGDLTAQWQLQRDAHMSAVERGRLGGRPKLVLDGDNKAKPKAQAKAELKAELKQAGAGVRTTTTSSSSPRESLLAAVPNRGAWEAEIDAATSGMHGPAVTPAQLDQAIGDFVGNGCAARPNMRQFRAYIRAAAQPPAAANGKRQQGGKPLTIAQRTFLNGTRAFAGAND